MASAEQIRTAKAVEMTMQDSPNMPVNGDPTSRVTAQLFREILALRELIEARQKGADDDRALLHAKIEKVPSLIAETTQRTNNIYDEKFRRIDTQILERDSQVQAVAVTSKTAVDAAMAAAEKAAGEKAESFALSIDKSERATVKLLDQQADQWRISTKNTDDKVSAVEKRLDRIEGMAIGQATQRETQQATHTTAQGSNQFVLALVVGFVAVASLLVAVFMAFGR